MDSYYFIVPLQNWQELAMSLNDILFIFSTQANPFPLL